MTHSASVHDAMCKHTGRITRTIRFAQRTSQMETKVTSTRTTEGTDKIIADKSIEDAKWLLGFVATLGTVVFATGFAAAAIGA